MRDAFECAYCRTHNPFSSYTRLFWNGKRGSDGTMYAVPQRCFRCGAAHGCLQGSVGVISPMMQPWIEGGRYSPWYPPEYRPVVRGQYDCTFRNELNIRLFWNGIYWQVDKNNPQRVDMRTLYKWRGVWHGQD